MRIPTLFELIWFHRIRPSSSTDVFLKRWHLGKSVHVRYVAFFFSFFFFFWHLVYIWKVKKTHLFCSQRIKDFKNPDKYTLDPEQSVKVLGDAQSEALNGDKLGSLMEGGTSLSCVKHSEESKISTWGTRALFIRLAFSTPCRLIPRGKTKD